MGAIGGDWTEATYNHPTLGSGVIRPKSNEDSDVNPGGYRSNDDDNMIDGAGNMIDQMNLVRPSIKVKVAWDMNQDLTLQKVVDLASSPVPADWTFTHISGTIYGMSGKPVGDIMGGANNATFDLKVAGSGRLKKIA